MSGTRISGTYTILAVTGDPDARAAAEVRHIMACCIGGVKLNSGTGITNSYANNEHVKWVHISREYLLMSGVTKCHSSFVAHCQTTLFFIPTEFYVTE